MPEASGSYRDFVKAFLLLTAAVLASVGIGVGAEAAAGPMVYGPAGAEFTAAFPTAPTVKPIVLHGLGGGGDAYQAQLGAEQLDITLIRVPGTGWSAYGPVYSIGSASSVRIGRADGESGAARLVMRPAAVDGQRVTLGVVCPAGAPCAGVLAGLDRLVGHELVLWSATAFGPTSGAVRALLTSVAPLDGTVPAAPQRIGRAG